MASDSDMSNDDDPNWRQLVEQLGEGNVVEIPCADERDFARRSQQIVKRAEKHGIAVDVAREASGLRVTPRGATTPVDTGRTEEERAAREQRRVERMQRKEDERAERERRRQ
jgi:hypothetical protein